MSRRELAEIIHLRLSELLGLISKEIHKAGSANPVLAGAVISGGSAQIPGLPELVDETLHLPTRIGFPVAAGGLADVFHDPAYATGVGLVLYGHRMQQGGGRNGPRSKKTRGSKAGLWSRLKKWFKEVV
jgi:cell division protein FtsA